LTGVTDAAAGREQAGPVTAPDPAPGASSSPSSFRDRVRPAAAPSPDVPELDVRSAPDEPVGLFLEWLVAAVAAGVVQAHGFVLSTASTASGPTARTLLLKDVDDAFWFTSSALSPKGRQIAEDDRVALTFTWLAQGRQVRVAGSAVAGPRDVAEQDFRHRHPDSRAVAIAVPQSTEIGDDDAAEEALVRARARVEADDQLVPDDWTAYRVLPVSVEFWQATTGRDQVRVRYDRVGDDWRRVSLWP
jgi:pyridoxamine 5'-phosphate oxidase